MLNYLLIFLGAGLGGVSRYVLVTLTSRIIVAATYPLGTLIVNVAGCFLIGFLAPLFLQRYPLIIEQLRSFFIIGFLGGFTTFSTFTLDTFNLLNNSTSLMALGYVLASVLLALFATGLGLFCANSFLN